MKFPNQDAAKKKVAQKRGGLHKRAKLYSSCDSFDQFCIECDLQGISPKHKLFDIFWWHYNLTERHFLTRFCVWLCSTSVMATILYVLFNSMSGRNLLADIAGAVIGGAMFGMALSMVLVTFTADKVDSLLNLVKYEREDRQISSKYTSTSGSSSLTAPNSLLSSSLSCGGYSYSIVKTPFSIGQSLGSTKQMPSTWSSSTTTIGPSSSQSSI